jgi:hypothetical protein
MNIVQDEKMGGGTAPEFEEEVIVFIRMGVFLPESENCPQKYSTPQGVTQYSKEELREWK